MLVEYVSCKYSRLRWQSSNVNENIFIAGTWDNGPNNKLEVWSAHDAMSDSELDQLDRHGSTPFVGDVTQLCPFYNSMLAVSSSTGSLSVYTIKTVELDCNHSWQSLHDGSCNDVVYHSDTKELIACGDDGNITLIKLDDTSAAPVKIKVSETSVQCLDVLSRQQVVCGNSAGHLKLFDMRRRECAMSMPGSLSSVLCVKRNPGNAHIVSSGNEIGELCVWDLRKTSSLVQMAAHSGAFTDLSYDETMANILYSSSNDGRLIRWNIEPNSTCSSADCIAGKERKDLPISSFNISRSNKLIFASDNETIIYGQL